MSTETLGEFIRIAREKRELTLRRFAEHVGISAAHQSDIEHNRRKPSPPLMKKMAEALGVDLEELNARDARMPADMKEWVEKHPELTNLLKELRKSGRPVEDLVVAWKRVRGRSTPK